MIFHLKESNLGQVCIVTQDGLICGVQIAESKERALFNAMSDFDGYAAFKSFEIDEYTQYDPTPNINSLITAHKQYFEEILNPIIQIINGESGDFAWLYKKIYLLNLTKFQKLVLERIQKIPFGETLSYKQLATLIGKPKAVRAVGSACGRNPIAILIPCHRIIKSNQELGEYRWGKDLKTKLLERENIQILL